MLSITRIPVLFLRAVSYIIIINEIYFMVLKLKHIISDFQLIFNSLLIYLLIDIFNIISKNNF